MTSHLVTVWLWVWLFMFSPAGDVFKLNRVTHGSKNISVYASLLEPHPSPDQGKEEEEVSHIKSVIVSGVCLSALVIAVHSAMSEHITAFTFTY